MNSIPHRLQQLLGCVRHAAAVACAAICLLGSAPSASGSLLPAFSVKVVSGYAENTVTSLEFINDVTIRIESEQVGHLSGFGDFTGHFSYLALATPTTITLLGSATLTNERGEQLYLAASLLEVGADYPLTVTGALAVLGGTGRFAGATGTLSVSGTDDEDLTDTFHLNGVLITSSWR